MARQVRWDRRESGLEAMVGLIRSGAGIDGVMCVNDAVAVGALRAAALAEELPLVTGCDGLHAIVWDEVLGERQLVWSGGRLVHSAPDPRTTARPASYGEAVAELARLVDPEPVRG